MEFRPFTLELIEHCAQTTYCTDCKLRIGCPVRRDFYQKSFLEDETAFEVYLQTLELQLAKYFGEETSFKAFDHIRQKCYAERRINPHFSYL